MSERRVGECVAAFESVGVRYGKTLAADSVTLEVERGGVFALLGRNGAGKSSLVRCLLGQQKPTAGRAELFGEDAWTSRRRAMARVGVVPEEPDAPPEMTAAQVVGLCARLTPGFDGQNARERLVRFGVPLATPAGRLSKGQKGQLGLALALAHHPELLVLDDPTLGLDVVARKALYEELVGDLADRGTTVFLTTHDLAGVEAIVEQVGVLVEGRLVIDEAIESLKGRFRRVRFGGVPTAGQTGVLPELGALAVERGAWGAAAVLSRFDEAAYAHLCELGGTSQPEISGMSLEEIFIAVHGNDGEVRP